MALQIGDTAPDFQADTTEGEISFHEWIGDSWAVLFSHPKDFTPVCTTELGYMAKIKPEFDRRNVKIIGLSVDTTSDHEGWARDIEETQGTRPTIRSSADADFSISKPYGMLPAETSGDPKARTPADNQTVRNVFVIGPDKKIKLILVYPMTTGRNFDEVLRVIDSLQLTATHKVSTPVNWKQGEDVIIAGSVSNDEAKELSGTLGVAEALHPDRAAAAAGPVARSLERLLAADQRAQALVLLAARRAAREVGAQPGTRRRRPRRRARARRSGRAASKHSSQPTSGPAGPEQPAEGLLQIGSLHHVSSGGCARSRAPPGGVGASAGHRAASCRAHRGSCPGALRGRRSACRSAPTRPARAAGAASAPPRSRAAARRPARSAPPPLRLEPGAREQAPRLRLDRDLPALPRATPQLHRRLEQGELVGPRGEAAGAAEVVEPPQHATSASSAACAATSSRSPPRRCGSAGRRRALRSGRRAAGARAGAPPPRRASRPSAQRAHPLARLGIQEDRHRPMRRGCRIHARRAHRSRDRSYVMPARAGEGGQGTEAGDQPGQRERDRPEGGTAAPARQARRRDQTDRLDRLRREREASTGSRSGCRTGTPVVTASR